MVFRKTAGIAAMIYGAGGVLGVILDGFGWHPTWLSVVFSLAFGISLVLAGLAFYHSESLR